MSDILPLTPICTNHILISEHIGNVLTCNAFPTVFEKKTVIISLCCLAHAGNSGSFKLVYLVDLAAEPTVQGYLCRSELTDHSAYTDIENVKSEVLVLGEPLLTESIVEYLDTSDDLIDLDVCDLVNGGSVTRNVSGMESATKLRLNCENVTEGSYRAVDVTVFTRPFDLAVEILTELGLGDEKDMNAFPSELSGGMKRRVAIARALAYKSKVLILDEALRGLDEKNFENAIDVIERYRDGRTVISVTHVMSRIEENADTVIDLDSLQNK